MSEGILVNKLFISNLLESLNYVEALMKLLSIIIIYAGV